MQMFDLYIIRAEERDFKVEGPLNNETCCWPPWLADKKKFGIPDTLEWLKQKHFDLGDNLLIVSALKLFLFFLFSLFFVLRKKLGPIAPLPSPPRLVVAGPDYVYIGVCSPYKITPLYFLALSKVSSILHRGSVWGAHKKMQLNAFMYFFGIFVKL